MQRTHSIARTRSRVNPPPSCKVRPSHYASPRARAIVALLRQAGPLTAEEIVRRLWGADYLRSPYRNTFDSTMYRVRHYAAPAAGLRLGNEDGVYFVTPQRELVEDAIV